MKNETLLTLKQKRILETLGENIRLCRLRRKMTLRSLAERSGIAVSTMTNIESGSPSVSLGNYLQVLTVLKLEDDLLLIADKDPLGRYIQDAGLTVKKRAPKKKTSAYVLDGRLENGLSEPTEFK
jgi:transcriptional regulator with XRE-family HTH domain